MHRVLFRRKALHFAMVSLFGIIAGLLVVFFSRFPTDDLWAFAGFSSSSLGFWFFTTSLLVLFSETRLTAAVNAALYVFWMFEVTGAGKWLRSVQRGMGDAFSQHFAENLLYSLSAALLCAVLGLILWHGRLNGVLCKIMRCAPAFCIAAEALLSAVQVIRRHSGLFMLLLDSICAAVYIIIIFRNRTQEQTEPIAPVQ